MSANLAQTVILVEVEQEADGSCGRGESPRHHGGKQTESLDKKWETFQFEILQHIKTHYK